MKIRTKAVITGGFIIKHHVSFSLNEVAFNLFSLNERNYIEATRQVTGYQDVLNGGLEKIFEYEYDQEKILIKALKFFESIGSFLFRIQEIRYDERETDWIAESDEEKAVVDRLPKDKWSIDKDDTLIEISEDKIKQLITLCSNITDDIFAFEYLRQGNVSFRKGNYYFAFINYFMLLEETFGKGVFKTDKLEENFSKSDVLHLCVLTAIDILRRTPLESLYVEWMQKEVKRRQKEWDFSGVVCCIVRFRGDYFHSKKRTKILEQRDQFFKHMAAFTQAVCWAYCCYVIYSENKNDNEKDVYIAEEIQRLNVIWHSNANSLSDTY